MLGRTVNYVNASGDIRPAIIVAVRDAAAKKVRVSILNEGATMSDSDNVPFNADRAPSSWHYAPEGVRRWPTIKGPIRFITAGGPMAIIA